VWPGSRHNGSKKHPKALDWGSKWEEYEHDNTNRKREGGEHSVNGTKSRGEGKVVGSEELFERGEFSVWGEKRWEKSWGELTRKVEIGVWPQQTGDVPFKAVETRALE